MKYSIIDAFEQNVRNIGNREAIVYCEKRITYGQLDKMVNDIAARLLRRNAKKGDFIGVYLEKSPDLIAAALAILKIGAVYVPIAHEYPKERLEYIIHDAGLSCILIDEKDNDYQCEKELITVNNKEYSEDVKLPRVEQCKISKDDLAYVIYTSGTTGTPKGVMIHHEGFANRIKWQMDYFDVQYEDKVLMKAPIGFDISLWEMFLPIYSGATCVIAKENGYKDISYLISLIESEKITIAQFVPSILRFIIEISKEPNCSLKNFLKKLVSSGEELNKELVQECLQVLPKTNLYNFYGPTETSICVSACLLNEIKDFTYIPLGDAIRNMNLFLLDEDMQKITEDGVKGEIYITGIGVGKGYINKPEQTRKAFLPSIEDKNKKMYKTGDIGFYYKGNIIYVGRNDQTIKLQGNRIDLGEIEAKIYEQSFVEQTVVKCIQKDNGAKVLVAFLKLNSDDKEKYVQEIKTSLKRTLPKYMIPQFFVTDCSFELTANGKIDKTKLTMQFDDASLADDRQQFETKEIIRQAFSNVSHLSMSDEDDFFEMGGSSLEAIQILMIINREIQLNLPFGDVVDDFSIKGIASIIGSRKVP
ncbi:non-ribosomal peptide synthetase [[Clostridium] polysaccharolyticum]|uniref:Amino acid adenylation domain-containing protein n=1 Tax=[Clostridium] polysaccharolyticum TaxID=29364 RepID=A0A1I0BEZ9_9FIRM|nr:non-ribosomal peptide synthetase [[Clostridium] polysaccharolyticum]SET04738.1 amino acid adenylation domain-containing protein [[Clostridium] polysaccharolyticum]